MASNSTIAAPFQLKYDMIIAWQLPSENTPGFLPLPPTPPNKRPVNVTLEITSSSLDHPVVAQPRL